MVRGIAATNNQVGDFIKDLFALGMESENLFKGFIYGWNMRLHGHITNAKRCIQVTHQGIDSILLIPSMAAITIINAEGLTIPLASRVQGSVLDNRGITTRSKTATEVFVQLVGIIPLAERGNDLGCRQVILSAFTRTTCAQLGRQLFQPVNIRAGKLASFRTQGRWDSFIVATFQEEARKAAHLCREV